MTFNYKQDHPALSKAAKRMRIKYENQEYPPAYYEQYKDKLICIVRTGVDTYNVYFKTG